jgi:hypothetical protein
MKAEFDKDLIRSLLIHAIDFCLAFDFGLRDWTRIARALHAAGDVAEVLSHKDGLERHRRKLKKVDESEREKTAVQAQLPSRRLGHESRFGNQSESNQA